MTDAEAGRMVGDTRCWPCTITNGLVALVVAGIPLYGALGTGEPTILAVTVLWAVAVVGYTLYRLVSRGYLPGAARVAKATGLHDRIGPGRHDPDSTHRGEEPSDDRGDSSGS